VVKSKLSLGGSLGPTPKGWLSTMEVVYMADKAVLEADLRYYKKEHAKSQEEVLRLEREVVRLKKMVDDVIANRKKLAEFYHQRILEEFQESFRG
jgi:3-methyladenine DNA glycosylase AlkD